MDSWEWNKIAGAVLGTLIFVLVIKFVAEAIYETKPPAKPGYVVEGVQEDKTATAAAAPTEEALPDFGAVLPTADAAAGKGISSRCEQCHDLSKGGPNKIGPNLWGVVGRARATHPGFDYSSAMAASHDVWDFDKLFRFLKSPQGGAVQSRRYDPSLPASGGGLRAPLLREAAGVVGVELRVRDSGGQNAIDVEKNDFDAAGAVLRGEAHAAILPSLGRCSPDGRHAPQGNRI